MKKIKKFKIINNIHTMYIPYISVLTRKKTNQIHVLIGKFKIIQHLSLSL